MISLAKLKELHVLLAKRRHLQKVGDGSKQQVFYKLNSQLLSFQFSIQKNDIEEEVSLECCLVYRDSSC